MAKKKILDEVLFSMEQGSLIGISNHLKDYQMAYFLNKLLNIELEREKDFYFYISQKMQKKNTSLPSLDLYSIDYQNSSENMLPYSLYTCVDDVNHLMYILLSTRSGGILLHESFRTFDRLLFIFGRDHLNAAQNMLSFQKEIPNTLLTRLFNFKTISNISENEKNIPISKEEKSQKKTYDFLLGLLEDLEFYFMEIKSEEGDQVDIVV